MERWFGGFKRELGSLTQYKDLPQLHEAIAVYIHYYNTKRIHAALGMSPAAYAAQLKSHELQKVWDKVFAKRGGWQGPKHIF